MAYIRLVINPRDDEAFKRIVNYPARGIGDTTVQRIAALAAERGVSMWEAVDALVAEPVTDPVQRTIARKVADFVAMIRALSLARNDKGLYDFGLEIASRSGIIAAYRYRFALYNLCENPELGVMEALAMSKAQTLGFKWQLFVLDLSFIGWNILVSLTLGILDIWVAPYRAQANIAFFQEIKKIKGVGFFPPRPEDDDQFRPHDPFGEDNW
jgi:hypothetical protein